jgi:hypothetical protein
MGATIYETESSHVPMLREGETSNGGPLYAARRDDCDDEGRPARRTRSARSAAPAPAAHPGREAGMVRIRIEAFGLNRSELHLRLGLAENATFPRVPGIECAGVVEAAPGWRHPVLEMHRGQRGPARVGIPIQ